MALVISNKPGNLIVVDVPAYEGIGILKISDRPTNQAIVVSEFAIDIKARISVDHALSNYKYIYVFGTSLTDLSIDLMLFPFIGCSPSQSLTDILYYLDGKLVSAFGAPRLHVIFDNSVSWRGIVHAASIRSGAFSNAPEICTAKIVALGNFV